MPRTIFKREFVRTYRAYLFERLMFCRHTLSPVELRNLTGARNWRVFK